MIRGKCLLGAAAIAACAFMSAATLRAVDVSVSPIEGGIGQQLALRSFDFTPVKKPRVRLVPHPDQTAKKAVWATVTAFGAEQIDATVTKGAAGVYDVVVVPKDRGVEDVTLGQPFTILLPAPEVTDPVAGPKGTEVTIHGAFFGPSKGKVTIGGKKGKVKTWTDDTIVVVVPKKAPAGDQPVVVTNRAGASTAGLTFAVAAGAPGGGGGGGGGGANNEYLRADVSGKPRIDLTNAGPALQVMWDPGSQQIVFRAITDLTDGFPMLELDVFFVDIEQPKPIVVGLEQSLPSFALANAQYTELEGGAAPVAHVAFGGAPGAALTVTITAWDGTFLSGTFSGTLVDPVGGTPPITVSNGQFHVRLQTGI